MRVLVLAVVVSTLVGCVAGRMIDNNRFDSDRSRAGRGEYLVPDDLRVDIGLADRIPVRFELMGGLVAMEAGQDYDIWRDAVRQELRYLIPGTGAFYVEDGAPYKLFLEVKRIAAEDFSGAQEDLNVTSESGEVEFSANSGASVVSDVQLVLVNASGIDVASASGRAQYWLNKMEGVSDLLDTKVEQRIVIPEPAVRDTIVVAMYRAMDTLLKQRDVWQEVAVRAPAHQPVSPN